MKSRFLDFGDCNWQEFVSKEHNKLRKTDKDFAKLNKKLSDLLNQYPKLRKFVEDEEVTSFTKEEIVALRQYYLIDDEINIMLEMQLYIRGFEEAIRKCK